MSLGRPIRYRCDLAAPLAFEGLGEQRVRILDLSETGAFVETDLELQYGDVGRMGIAFPGGDPWGATVRVSRLGASQREVRHPRVENVTVLRPGVGLTFEDIPDDERERLLGFLELLDER
ncbi:MAG: PilZ domain-containing protein [Myxococcaceae bacterium]